MSFLDFLIDIEYSIFYNYNYKIIILNKMFKKRKDNQNKATGRKRKIFVTIALSLSLLFAKPQLSFSQSSSPKSTTLYFILKFKNLYS